MALLIGHWVSTSASIDIPRPRAEVFDFCCRNDTYERHLRPRLPVAGVARAELLGNGSIEAGGRRRVVLTDGSELEEVILEYSPHTLHSYRWSKGLKGPFSLLVRSGTGSWRFSDVPGGTQVDWGYDFELKSPLAYPLALPVMPLFRAWLSQSLESIRNELTS